MKRRNFIKGLAALAIAPVAAIANTSTPSPAQLSSEVEYLKPIRKANKTLCHIRSDTSAKEARLRESLENIYLSQEMWEDIKVWDADPIDNLREEIQYNSFTIPDYYKDHVEFHDGIHPDFLPGGKLEYFNQNAKNNG